MSVFSYDGIKLFPVLTKRYSRQAILHGPTYLYTRHTLRVQGIFNPYATSYSGKPEDPTAGQGNLPNMTDNAIRHRLLQPRRQLIFTSGYPACDNEPFPFLASSEPPVIRSPYYGTKNELTTIFAKDSLGKPVIGSVPPTDANNGPIPIACDVVRIGPNSWWVDFAIKTDINECYTYYKTPPFVLSNRWNMTHDIDVNNFTTRYVRGRAIFNTDAMLRQAVTPDMYRAAFFFPLPNNFQREQVRVWVSEDNNELNYSFVDRQKSHTIMMIGITRIESWATINKSLQSAVEAVASGIPGAGRTGSLTRASVLSHGASASRAGWAGIAAAAAQLIGTTYVAVQPVYSVSVTARVWGTSDVTRKQLIAVADKVLRIKIPQAFGLGSNLGFSSESTANFDLMGRYVDLTTNLVSGRVSAGIGATGLGWFAGNDPNGPAELKIWPELLEDNIGTGNDTIATTDPAVGRDMVNYAGSRGTYLEMCVAQALQNVCQLPQQPQQAPAAPSPQQDYLKLPAPK